MTTYWFALASRSEFTVLAWLNSAMFGPIDTSYQLLNHSAGRSEEHTSELQSLMRISYAVFCLKKNTSRPRTHPPSHNHIHTVRHSVSTPLHHTPTAILTIMKTR